MPSFKPIDDRQVIQRSALSISIGSSANTTLDALFTQIDSVMVNLAGTQTLTNKTLAFLRTNVITDSTTTGAAATLPSPDIANGTVRLTNASLTSVSGITAGLSSQSIIIENQTGTNITINDDDAGASVGNRIYTAAGNVSMPENASFAFVYDATVAHWMLEGITSGAKVAPTISIVTLTTFSGGFNSVGSGTYTTPTSPAPLYIEIEMVGGGGGGANGTNGTGGSNGANTTFGTSLLTATGGLGGVNNGTGGGVSTSGSTGTVNSPAVGFIIQGGSGTGTSAAATSFIPGGSGGNSAWGGGGGGNNGNSSTPEAGSNAASNTGGGGGGGGGLNIAGGGGGGSAAGYIKATISSPAATYLYSVGGGGSGGANGGQGGSGQIIVREYYQ